MLLLSFAYFLKLAKENDRFTSSWVELGDRNIFANERRFAEQSSNCGVRHRAQERKGTGKNEGVMLCPGVWMSVKMDLRSYEKPQVETAHGTSLAPRIEEPAADGAFLVSTIHQIRCITRGPTNHELIQSSKLDGVRVIWSLGSEYEQRVGRLNFTRLVRKF